MLSHEEAWRRYDAVEVRLTAPVSERMLDLADLRPGMRVLDLATGRGEPALRAAQRIGPEGLVVGVDLSDGLLEMARERGDGMGLANLDLRVGNAEELHDLPSAHFHAVTARWGLMYMTDPVAALATARRALVPTGVLVAAFWAEPELTPFINLPRRLLERYRDVPEIDVEVPGPFRYDALERITRDFDRAGLAVDHIEEMEIPVFEAEAATEVVDWARVFGMEKLLAELPESDQRAWEQDFASQLERGRTGGLIQVGGVTRIVRARPIEPKR